MNTLPKSSDEDQAVLLSFLNRIGSHVHADVLRSMIDEIVRLRSGRLTPDELQNLCHNLTPSDRVAFFQGCEAEQRKLFGCGAVEQERQRCLAIVKIILDESDHLASQQWLEYLSDKLARRIESGE